MDQRRQKISSAAKKVFLLGAGALALLVLFALLTGGVFGSRPMMYGPGGMMGKAARISSRYEIEEDA